MALITVFQEETIPSTVPEKVNKMALMTQKSNHPYWKIPSIHSSPKLERPVAESWRLPCNGATLSPPQKAYLRTRLKSRLV